MCLYESSVDEDDQIISSFHWLMKISVPEYSPVRFIEVQISHCLLPQCRDPISHLVEHFNRAEYYLTYYMPRSVNQFARDSKLLCFENLKGVSIQGRWYDYVELTKIDFKFFPRI
jgi:hypothetical protein